MVITVTAAAVAGRRLGTTTSDPTQVLPTGPTDPHALPHRIPDTADTDDTMLPMAVLNVMAPRTVRVGVAILLHPQLLQLVHEKLSLVFSETVHDRRHAPIEIAHTHL